MSTSNDTPDLFEQMAEPTTSEIKDMSVESSGGKPPAIPIDLTAGDGDTLPLAAYAERAYLAYAMSVVRARALPQVEDGLKPVHRRSKRYPAFGCYPADAFHRNHGRCCHSAN